MGPGARGFPRSVSPVLYRLPQQCRWIPQPQSLGSPRFLPRLLSVKTLRLWRPCTKDKVLAQLYEGLGAFALRTQLCGGRGSLVLCPGFPLPAVSLHSQHPLGKFLLVKRLQHPRVPPLPLLASEQRVGQQLEKRPPLPVDKEEGSSFGSSQGTCQLPSDAFGLRSTFILSLEAS